MAVTVVAMAARRSPAALLGHADILHMCAVSECRRIVWANLSLVNDVLSRLCNCKQTACVAVLPYATSG